MQTAIVDEEKRHTQMRALEKFLAHVKKNVCTVYTICRALYLRGGFRSLPSN